jgi:hypothetical protein
MPPWAQSFAWIFMVSPPVPFLRSATSSSFTSSVIALFRTRPRWSGILLAKTGVARPPVMSSSLAAPVKA